MTNREKVRLRLNSEKEFINKLISLLDEGEDINITDINDILWTRYFDGPYIIGLLKEISKKVSSQRGTCRFTNDDDGYVQMLLGPKGISNIGVRQDGLREVRNFTKDASKLIIIDPYIYGGSKEKAEKYIDEFKKASRIDSKPLSEIHIIYSSKHGNTPAMKKGIKKLASDNNCSISDFDTDKIHDRIWIKDKKEAIVVGTSFGGIGGRLCFILELPKYDLDSLLDFLNDEGMLNKHTHN